MANRSPMLTNNYRLPRLLNTPLPDVLLCGIAWHCHPVKYTSARCAIVYRRVVLHGTATLLNTPLLLHGTALDVKYTSAAASTV